MKSGKFLEPIRLFWQQRNERERTLISWVLVGGALILLYLVLIQPPLTGRVRLQKKLPELRLQAAEFQVLAEQATNLSRQATQPVEMLNKATIEGALKRKGLVAQSVIPSGDMAKVQLSGVAFAGLIDWLDEVQKLSHWQVVDANISAQSAVGTVNATLTLWQQKHE